MEAIKLYSFLNYLEELNILNSFLFICQDESSVLIHKDFKEFDEIFTEQNVEEIEKLFNIKYCNDIDLHDYDYIILQDTIYYINKFPEIIKNLQDYFINSKLDNQYLHTSTINTERFTNYILNKYNLTRDTFFPIEGFIIN